MKYRATLIGGAIGLFGAVIVAGAQPAPPRDTLLRDTAVVNAVERMGSYLRTLTVMQVRAKTTQEEVLTTGEKIQSESVIDLVAEKPNHFRVQITNDKQPRTMYYDGSTFTVWAPRLKFYGTVDAPPTIKEVAETLTDKYDIELPLVDLFRWGTPDGDLDLIKGARYIGPSVINDITCDQFALRQDGIDWQLWIQNGDFPLPLKVVITTLTDTARPQYSAVYTWNLAPSFDDDAFKFIPPADAKKIKIAEVGLGLNKKRETPR